MPHRRRATARSGRPPADRVQDRANDSLRCETLERLEPLGEGIKGKNSSLAWRRKEIRSRAETRLIHKRRGVEQGIAGTRDGNDHQRRLQSLTRRSAEPSAARAEEDRGAVDRACARPAAPAGGRRFHPARSVGRGARSNATVVDGSEGAGAGAAVAVSAEKWALWLDPRIRCRTRRSPRACLLRPAPSRQLNRRSLGQSWAVAGHSRVATSETALPSAGHAGHDGVGATQHCAAQT